ncbi:MAG: hypothetical protein WKF31_01970 [Thermoleophilaceae bacterium]
MSAEDPTSPYGPGGPEAPDAPGGAAGDPTEAEMRAALEEQMRNVQVGDVLLQTTVTLINLGARRLGLTGPSEERDLDQARLAIEGARALVGLLPPQEGNQLREPLSQLQIAYARGAGEPGVAAGGRDRAPECRVDRRPRRRRRLRGSAGAGSGPRPGPEPRRRPPGAEEAERAKARARIWTPRGN